MTKYKIITLKGPKILLKKSFKIGVADSFLLLLLLIFTIAQLSYASECNEKVCSAKLSNFVEKYYKFLSNTNPSIEALTEKYINLKKPNGKIDENRVSKMIIYDLEQFLSKYNFIYADNLMDWTGPFTILSSKVEDWTRNRAQSLYDRRVSMLLTLLQNKLNLFFKYLSRKSWDIHFMTEEEYIESVRKAIIHDIKTHKLDKNKVDIKATLKLHHDMYSKGPGKTLKGKKIQFDFINNPIRLTVDSISKELLWGGWSNFITPKDAITMLKDNPTCGKELSGSISIVKEAPKLGPSAWTPGPTTRSCSCQTSNDYFLYSDYQRTLLEETGDFYAFHERILLVFRIDDALVSIDTGIDLPGSYIGKSSEFKRMVNDISQMLIYSFLGPSHQVQGEPSVDLSPLSTVNLNTSPDKKDTCTLQVTVTDDKGKPVKGTSVTLKKPKIGKLSSLSLITDAGGQAKVVYTAPTDKVLEKLGKEEANVLIEATDARSGKSSSVEIHVRSKKSKIATRVQHEILPAHPDYYNEISFAFRAANKPDASPYKTVIAIQKGGYGALVKKFQEIGGVKKLEMKVWPKNKYNFYYHWTGPTAMMKAYDEAVTIEIPELKLKKTVKFSVGIDLMIQSVQMKYGTNIYTAIFNPINVFVADKFHPKADLEKLFEVLGINLDLKIKLTSHNPAPPDPKQEELLSTLMTLWEGSSHYPHIEPIVYDGALWGIHKTREGRYRVIWKGEAHTGHEFVQYPGIDVFERGDYQFDVAVSPGKFDADPRNNHELTPLLAVKGFASEGQEILHTALLPSIQFLLLSMTDLPFVEASKKIKTLIGCINLGLTGEDAYEAIKQRDYKKLFIDMFSSYMGTLNEAKLSTKAKELYKIDTLALYTESLVEKLVALKPDIEKRSLFKFNLVTPVFAGQHLSMTKRGDSESEVLSLSQLTLKGAKGHYLTVIEKQGLANFEIETTTGETIRLALPGIRKNRENQRIYSGDRFAVFAAKMDERIRMNLAGNGHPGKIIIITPKCISYYKFPPSKWKSLVEIDASGNLTTIKGNGLEPINILKVAGTWKTTWGKLVLEQHGNVVKGHYTHDNGKIVGVLKGNILTGKWSEAPTYKPPHDAGDVVITFSNDGKSFTGKWRYGYGGNSWPHSDWTGTKVSTQQSNTNLASNQPLASINVAGTWKTNFGEMILVQRGNIVTGSYTHDQGRLTGKIEGNVLAGKWSESPTYKPPHDAGDFRFVFSKDGKSFSGKWRYGFGGNSWSGNWSGKR